METNNNENFSQEFDDFENESNADVNENVNASMAEAYAISPENELGTGEDVPLNPDPEGNPANVSPKEEEKTLKNGYTIEERIEYAKRNHSISRNVAMKNNRAFYNAVSNNTLPAFNLPASKDKAVKIPAVISFVSGKAYQGLNQLIGQKYVRDLGFTVDLNGNYPVLTFNQAGGFSNLNRGRNAPHYSFATINNGMARNKETGVFERRRYSNGEEVKPYFNLYTVCSPGDLKDVRKAITVPEEQRTRLTESKIEIDATDPNMSGKDYLIKYLAATQNGFSFKTTPEVQESMRQKVLADLNVFKQKDEEYKIGSYTHEISVASQKLAREEKKVYYSTRGREIAALSEKQKQDEMAKKSAHNKSMASAALER